MRLKQLSHAAILFNVAAGYLIPIPPGRFNVTLTTGTLTDYNRNGRTLTLSVFQPTRCAHTVPVQYMPNKTAEYQGQWAMDTFNISADLSPLLLEARLPVCPNDDNSCSPIPHAPIILLSPGYRGTRLYYNAVASAIASEGFMVITMDHPGETNVITYPDGHVVYTNLPNVDDANVLTPYTYIRAADAAFVIDQLSNATAVAELLPQQKFSKLPTDRIAMIGHSLGGAAAVLAAGTDPRIRTVINLDGLFLGSLPPSGLSQPVLYIGADHEDIPPWSAIWPEIKGPKLWIKVANITHEGMLDISTLLGAAGLGTEYWASLTGTLPATEWIRILVAYTTDWVNGVFAGKLGGPLLEGQEPDRFPAVSTRRRENF